MKPVTSRWGKDDEVGAFNLIDSVATLRGLQSVRLGRVLSLSVPIRGGSHGPSVPTRPPAQHYMLRDGGDYCAGRAERHGFGFADDVLTIATHGSTHIDALAHVWRDGQMYNGFEASEVDSRGAARCGIDKLGPVVTRALFVDLAEVTGPDADRPISLDALMRAVERGGIDPEPGDALLLRTGWMSAFKEGRGSHLRSAGLHHECADWILERGFALVAGDNVAVEALPSADPQCAVPLHIRLIRDNGIYLAELLDLDELAMARVPACMLVIAALRILGGVGSPINPVAVL